MQITRSLTLAADMRLRAMLPEASTTNMTSAPALRASFLLRMSDRSTYTAGVQRKNGYHHS